jgi:hypothetical protein
MDLDEKYSDEALNMENVDKINDMSGDETNGTTTNGPTTNGAITNGTITNGTTTNIFGSKPQQILSENASKLYDILMNERERILNFILGEETGKYCNLFSLFQYIEKNNLEFNSKSRRGGIIYDMFVGNPKEFIAFYMIPSHETITLIENLIGAFSIQFVEEVCAGMGLLAALTKKKIKNQFNTENGLNSMQNIKIWASDNFSLDTTVGKLDLITVSKKDMVTLLKYPLLGSPIPDLILCAFPYFAHVPASQKNTIVEELITLINDSNAKVFVLFHYMSQYMDIARFITYINAVGKYDVYIRYAKCFTVNDFPSTNYLHDVYPSRTLIITFIRKDLRSIYCGCGEQSDLISPYVREEAFNKIIGDNTVFENKFIPCADEILISLDIINSSLTKKSHEWLFNTFNPTYSLSSEKNKEFYKLSKICSEVISSGSPIPEFIDGVNDFNDWYSIIWKNKINLYCQNHDQFIKAIGLMKQIKSQSIIELQIQKLLPDWVHSVSDAIVYAIVQGSVFGSHYIYTRSELYEIFKSLE